MRARGAGWAITIPFLAVLAVSAGVAAWAFAALLLPALDAGLEDVGWPPIPFDALFLLFPVSFMVVALLVGVLTYAGVWTRSLPLLSPIGGDIGAWGIAAGLGFAALQIFIASGALPAAYIAGVGALLVAVIAAVRTRRTRRGIRAQQAENERVAGLRARGTRVRAQVTAVRFTNTWLGGNLPVFDVTVAYQTPSGHRTATAILTTSPAAAPIVGGTVFILFLGNGDDSENVLVQVDSESLKDPDAAVTYEGGSPS